MKKKLLTILCAAAAGMLLISGSASAAEGHFGADKHLAHGLTCASCHGKEYEKNPQTPDINTCTKCHGPTEELAKKTAHLPQNPHKSPHYGTKLECTNCHVMHDETEDFCGQCHKFGFKVP